MQSDYFALVDSVMDCYDSDVVLLDFKDLPCADGIWDLIGNLSISIRKPLAFSAEDDETFEKLLRYYPGRAAVYVREGQKDIANFYGALIL